MRSHYQLSDGKITTPEGIGQLRFGDSRQVAQELGGHRVPGRGDQRHFVAEVRQLGTQCVEGSDGAVDLGVPGIGDDEDATPVSAFMRYDVPAL